jgi:hypothetical protein
LENTSSVVNLSVPVPVAPVLTGARKPQGRTFSFGFTNTVGALFGVRATTNPALPSTSWQVLGAATEVSPGGFQFTDPQAASNPRRFYRPA